MSINNFPRIVNQSNEIDAEKIYIMTMPKFHMLNIEFDTAAGPSFSFNKRWPVLVHTFQHFIRPFRTYPYIFVSYSKTYLVRNHSASTHKYSEVDLKVMLEYLSLLEFLWIQNVLPCSLTCFYILMNKNSFKTFYMRRLIDCIVVYAVSRIFRPYNGGHEKEKSLNEHLWHTGRF